MEHNWQTLQPAAEKIAALLKHRNETISIVESSSGGLVSAALLAVPGASRYFVGGAVLYTRQSWRAYRDYDDRIFDGTRAATEPNAIIRAKFIRGRMATHWGLGETGAAGPDGNSYGDPAGHTCVAVSGRIERAITVETGSPDRAGNMIAFAAAALELLAASLAQEAPGAQ